MPEKTCSTTAMPLSPAFRRSTALLPSKLGAVVTNGAIATLTVFGAASASQAQVTVYPSANLTDTISGSNVYFSPSTGVATLTSTAPASYQYNLNSVTGTTNLSVSAGSQIEQLGTANFSCPAKLAANATIDGTQPFSGNGSMASNSFGDNWSSSSEGYAGLFFTDPSDSTKHYGWADIAINADYTATLKTFAVNTTPNQGLLAGTSQNSVSSSAPEPDVLALLALGAPAFAAYRLRFGKRREDATISAD